jgi:mono/diheme cytochrome c family protein
MSEAPAGFKRFVNVIEVVVAVVAVAFIVMLFANQPDDGGDASGADASPGAAIYSESCAGCHGADGGGGVGPQLAGTVVDSFPDVAEEVAIVTGGRRGMPAFEGRLSPEEIEQVVEYTRTGLGS